MKKTLIALTVTSCFSFNALAATVTPTHITTGEIANKVEELEKKGDLKLDVATAKDSSYARIQVEGKDYYIETHQKDLDNATYTITDADGKLHNIVSIDGEIVSVNGEDATIWVDAGGNEVIDITDGTEMDVAMELNDIVNEVTRDENTTIHLTDGQGNEIEVINRENVQEYISAFDNMNDKQKAQALRDIKAAAENGQIEVKTDHGPNNDIITIDTEVDARIDKAGKAIYKEAAIAYNDLDSRVNSNSNRISGLESQMKKMGDKMLDLEDRMDGVVATSHAVTNARPMVQDAGEFAMGVGIGAAGSKQALALGGAYQFNANWSSSMTVNYETAGKRSNSQVSAGAGVQYRFK
ncbi:YadA C-terminal domain-containing protein [Vibrio mediterranei]|nr:YadA C-terminal domain-containing protein [Vibrio mediterranei]